MDSYNNSSFNFSVDTTSPVFRVSASGTNGLPLGATGPAAFTIHGPAGRAVKAVQSEPPRLKIVYSDGTVEYFSGLSVTGPAGPAPVTQGSAGKDVVSINGPSADGMLTTHYSFGVPRKVPFPCPWLPYTTELPIPDPQAPQPFSMGYVLTYNADQTLGWYPL